MGFGKGYSAFVFYKLLLFVIATLIFSIIFWATKKWFDAQTIKKRKKN
jgi:uncharacterized membrane protein (Fun14 family)|tara:strand:- start:516 stop:659 length:144 start_codon:yes stop_codon:yes gene_type:complete